MTAELCGSYADHVDHVVPVSAWAGYRRAGSTRRWRRVRAYVLDRDGRRCQLPVDAAGDYAPALDYAAAGLADDGMPTGAGLAAHPDDPANLRAACALHNLQRGDGNQVPAPATTNRGASWSWPS